MRGRASKLYFLPKKKKKRNLLNWQTERVPPPPPPVLTYEEVLRRFPSTSFSLSLIPPRSPHHHHNWPGPAHQPRSPFLFLSLVPKIPDFSEFHSFRVWGKGRSERRKATFHSRRPSPSLSPLSPFCTPAATFGEGELEHLPSTLGPVSRHPKIRANSGYNAQAFLLAATSFFPYFFRNPCR